MIRSELIQIIADENPHLYQRDVERIVNTVFSEITEALAKGDRVELRGFGAFSVQHRKQTIHANHMVFLRKYHDFKQHIWFS